MAKCPICGKEFVLRSGNVYKLFEKGTGRVCHVDCYTCMLAAERTGKYTKKRREYIK